MKHILPEHFSVKYTPTYLVIKMGNLRFITALYGRHLLLIKRKMFALFESRNVSVGMHARGGGSWPCSMTF